MASIIKGIAIIPMEDIQKKITPVREKLLTLQKAILILKKLEWLNNKLYKNSSVSWNLHELLKSYKVKYISWGVGRVSSPPPLSL